MRILIAEDDPKLLKSLVHIFTMQHCAVDGVGNGNDAFDYASSGEYDGLVLDVMMPGMDGVEAMKKIIESTDKTAEMAQIARKIAEDRYDVNKINMKIMKTMGIEG